MDPPNKSRHKLYFCEEKEEDRIEAVEDCIVTDIMDLFCRTLKHFRVNADSKIKQWSELTLLSSL